MNNLSSEILPLLSYYDNLLQKTSLKDTGPKFKVGEALSSVASFYERLRYAIDYKKEHLLRRNAIERILKRNLWEKGEANSVILGEALLKELTWARYIKNNYYSLGKINDIAEIISKYLVLSRNFAIEFSKKREEKWKDWLMGVASCEIEECLDPEVSSVDVLSMAVESWFLKKFNWVDGGLSIGEKEDELAIAIHRSLIRGDESQNAYYLLRRLYKNWNGVTFEEVERNKDEIYKICVRIRKSLASPIQSRLYRFVQKEVSAFQILKSLIDENLINAKAIFKDPQMLTSKVSEVCDEKYSEISSRVNRGIIRSIIYIFITKIVFAIAIEVPYELYFMHHLSYLPIVSSIAIPLIFVFLVTATIRKPGEENTKRVIDLIQDFVYQKSFAEKTDFSLVTRKKGLTYNIFTIAYLIIFVLLFTFISYALTKIGYDIVGIGIFFIFLSLILLFGYRVKFSASELSVVPKKESLASNLFTNLTLPFLDLGVWLSDKFASLNFFILFFDFLIEAPLKNIMGILDDWGNYLRERKEEAVEIPVER
jgi:hypothetical protein